MFKRLIKISEDKIQILAGSGVNHKNAQNLYQIGIRNFHLSGSEKNKNGILETNVKNIRYIVEKLEKIV